MTIKKYVISVMLGTFLLSALGYYFGYKQFQNDEAFLTTVREQMLTYSIFFVVFLLFKIITNHRGFRQYLTSLKSKTVFMLLYMFFCIFGVHMLILNLPLNVQYTIVPALMIITFWLLRMGKKLKE